MTKSLIPIGLCWQIIVAFDPADFVWLPNCYVFLSSRRLTALVVKVLSLVADRQIETKQQRGVTEKEISQQEIRKSVMYLIKTQNSDGSFSDSNPVIHREMQVLLYIFCLNVTVYLVYILLSNILSK